jgi:hypothetical protein
VSCQVQASVRLVWVLSLVWVHQEWVHLVWEFYLVQVQALLEQALRVAKESMVVEKAPIVVGQSIDLAHVNYFFIARGH